MNTLYVPGNTLLHRAPPSVKLAVLAVVGTVAFLIGNWAALLGLLLAVGLTYIVARIPVDVAVKQFKPALTMLVVFGVVKGLFDGWMGAADMIMRLSAIVLVASVVTLTTRTSAMLETLERGLAPLRAVGLNPLKTSMAFSLALRFIPMVREITLEVREAQQARGLERSIVTLALPMIIRVLRMADDVAEAIEARTFDA